MKHKNTKRIFIHIAIWVVVCLSVFFLINELLRSYARLGEETYVPNVTSLPIQEAIDTLSAYGFTFKISDTQLTSHLPHNHILFQYPESGSLIKSNRTISLVLSSFNAEKNILPNIVGEPIRTAFFKLQSIGVGVKDTVWVDTVLLGIVSGVFLGDKKLEEGAVLTPNNKVTLYVGNKKDLLIEVPDLLGLSELEARIVLQSRGLNLGTVLKGEGDPISAVVVNQDPAPTNFLNDKNKISQQSKVDIWLE